MEPKQRTKFTRRKLSQMFEMMKQQPFHSGMHPLTFFQPLIRLTLTKQVMCASDHQRVLLFSSFFPAQTLLLARGSSRVHQMRQTNTIINLNDRSPNSIMETNNRNKKPDGAWA
jgi:hypothetical protein